MKALLKQLRADWASSYSYFGGMEALGRCLRGTASVRLGRARRAVTDVETVTFSVIPGLTALWAALMRQATAGRAVDSIVVDCSGGLARWALPSGFRLLSLLNYHHGKKIDLILRRVCTAEYVLLNDDDVFWLSPEPLDWALEQFRRDERVAVVSLRPRPAVSVVMRDKVPYAMGSYCLMVRRSLWLNENLSFRIVQPPPSAGYSWFYDTADFAQMELLERGFEIKVAPDAIQEQFVDFDGLSSYGMRIRRFDGDLRGHFKDMRVRQMKAYQTVCAFEGFRSLTSALAPPHRPWPLFVPDTALAEARLSCREVIDPDLAVSVEQRVQAKLQRIADHIEPALPG